MDPLGRTSAHKCCEFLDSNLLASWNNPDDPFHENSDHRIPSSSKRENAYVESTIRARNTKRGNKMDVARPLHNMSTVIELESEEE